MPNIKKNKIVYGESNKLSHPIESLRFLIWKYRQNELPTLKNPIFIIGCPRSGTSIAVSLFANHPWVANLSEAGEVWDPKQYYDPNGDHCWGAEKVTTKAHKRLHIICEYYRQKQNKKRFVNKHPRNSVRIDYIRKIFPDAFFIHVIRDGRDVVNSIINLIRKEPRRQKIPFGDFCKPPNWQQFVCNDPIKLAAIQWKEIVSYILKKKEELDEKYFEFKYEEMCEKPREIFTSLYKFVGLPNTDEYMTGIPDKLSNMNNKYKKELTAEQIETINEIQKDLLKNLNYIM